MRILYPKLDPLLSSLMQQALFKCEMTRLELKSLQIFLAIKHCQQKKLESYQPTKMLIKKDGAYV